MSRKPAATTEETPTKSTAVATRETPGLPAFLQGQTGPTRGAEGIGSNDVRPPRLTLCQSMTPQRKRSDPNYIAGLDEGMLFNNITQEIYPAPLNFTVLKFLGKRGIEFAPADQGGGVVDFDVPINDARMQFTTDEETQKRVKPIATLFYDYLVILIHEDGRKEIAALSLKGTQIKVAIQLNTLMKMTPVDTFAVLYTLGVVEQKKDAYSFYNVKIERAKVDGKPAFVDEETYRFADAAFAQFAGKNVVIDREVDGERQPGEDEDLPY